MVIVGAEEEMIRGLKTTALTLAIAACAPTAPPSSTSSNTPPTIDAAPGGAVRSGTKAECTTKGRWKLSIQSSAGCPLPKDVAVVEGAGASDSDGGVPAMQWVVTANEASDGACRYALEGKAGRLFAVHAALHVQGSSISGQGEATASETRFNCSGPVELSGVRVP